MPYGMDVISVTDIVTVISKTSEVKEVKLPTTYRECEIIEQYIYGAAVDKENNIYVLRTLYIRTENDEDEPGSSMLFILDENSDVIQECKLDFLEGTYPNEHVRIAMNKKMISS